VERSAPAIDWRSRSPDETRALARALAGAIAADGEMVSLVGPLGAGKTVFAKGLAEGFGLPPALLASPTFTIAQEVPLPARAGGPRRLVHADCYRIESAGELEAAGLADWLAPGTVLVAEWGDRFPAALGAERLEVRIREREDGVREITGVARGARAERTLRAWGERCP
jgi:tRNA threonylcarbamoyladenosine biosynthesis protein TsaE